MRIEIRKSGEEACEACGAGELLYVPAANATLELELRGLLAEQYPRWRLLRRWQQDRFLARVDAAIGEMRQLTSRL